MTQPPGEKEESSLPFSGTKVKMTYYTMKSSSLVPDWFPIGAFGCTNAELPEVFGGERDCVAVEKDFDAA